MENLRKLFFCSFQMRQNFFCLKKIVEKIYRGKWTVVVYPFERLNLCVGLGQFFLSAGGDQVSEGLVVDLAAGDWGLALLHGVKLVLGEGFSTLVGQDLVQLVFGDEAGVGLVEHLEGTDDGGFWVGTYKSVTVRKVQKNSI